MGNLQTNLDTLVGKTVKRTHTVEAEVSRSTDKYLVIECEDGTRYILAYYEKLSKPCPNDLVVLEEAAKGGAFTVDEALARRRGEALGPRMSSKEKVKPEDVTVNNSRGVEDGD